VSYVMSLFVALMKCIWIYANKKEVHFSFGSCKM
jgi:hypothetical protein